MFSSMAISLKHEQMPLLIIVLSFVLNRLQRTFFFDVTVKDIRRNTNVPKKSNACLMGIVCS
jgi:hypothetical protein